MAMWLQQFLKDSNPQHPHNIGYNTNIDIGYNIGCTSIALATTLQINFSPKPKSI